MDRVLRIILVILITLVSNAITAGCSGGGTPVNGSQIGNQIGNRAPDFQLANLDGQSLSLKDFLGKPVFVNFWATWCPPCRSEMPLIQEVFTDKKWLDKNLVILAIDIGENQPKVSEFMKISGFTFPVLLDITQDISGKYNIRAIPASFFIDKDGKIQEIRIGAFPSKAELEKSLSKIIP